MCTLGEKSLYDVQHVPEGRWPVHKHWFRYQTSCGQMGLGLWWGRSGDWHSSKETNPSCGKCLERSQWGENKWVGGTALDVVQRASLCKRRCVWDEPCKTRGRQPHAENACVCVYVCVCVSVCVCECVPVFVHVYFVQRVDMQTLI